MLAAVLLWLISAVNAVIIADIYDFPHKVKPDTRVQLTIIFDREYGPQKQEYLMIKDLKGIEVLYWKGIADKAPQYTSTASLIRSPFHDNLEGVGLFALRKVEVSVSRMIIFDTIIPKNVEPGEYCITFTFPTSNVKLSANFACIPLRILATEDPELAEEATSKANGLFAGQCEVFVANMHNHAIRNMAEGQTGEVMYRHFKLTWFLNTHIRKTLLKTVWFSLTLPYASASIANYIRTKRALKQIEAWLEAKYSRAFVEKVRKLSNENDYNGMMKFAEEMYINDADVFERKRKHIWH